MNTTSKQLYLGYQMRSLIEFLLGDDARPGWLDKQNSVQWQPNLQTEHVK